MKSTAFALGDIVDTTRTYSGQYVKGKTFRITNARGYLQTSVMAPTSFYHGVKIDEKGNESGVQKNLRHGDLIYTRNKELRLAVLEDKIVDLKLEIKEVEDEIDFLTNYEDEEDYLAHKISDILKNKNDPAAIREILKSKPTCLL